MKTSAVQQIKEAALQAVLEAYGLVEKRAYAPGIGAGVGALGGLGLGHLLASYQGDDENANLYRAGGALAGGLLGGGVGYALSRHNAGGAASRALQTVADSSGSTAAHAAQDVASEVPSAAAQALSTPAVAEALQSAPVNPAVGRPTPASTFDVHDAPPGVADQIKEKMQRVSDLMARLRSLGGSGM